MENLILIATDFISLIMLKSACNSFEKWLERNED